MAATFTASAVRARDLRTNLADVNTSLRQMASQMLALSRMPLPQAAEVIKADAARALRIPPAPPP